MLRVRMSGFSLSCASISEKSESSQIAHVVGGELRRGACRRGARRWYIRLRRTNRDGTCLRHPCHRWADRCCLPHAQRCCASFLFPRSRIPNGGGRSFETCGGDDEFYTKCPRIFPRRYPPFSLQRTAPLRMVVQVKFYLCSRRYRIF